MRSAGADEETIKEVTGDLEEQQPVMLEANVKSFQWFLSVQSLLKTTGLDLPALQADTAMSRREYEIEDYEKLKHIGIEAAHALNEEHKSRQRTQRR